MFLSPLPLFPLTFVHLLLHVRNVQLASFIHFDNIALVNEQFMFLWVSECILITFMTAAADLHCGSLYVIFSSIVSDLSKAVIIGETRVGKVVED